jgi:hypothetical protein
MHLKKKAKTKRMNEFVINIYEGESWEKLALEKKNSWIRNPINQREMNERMTKWMNE